MRPALKNACCQVLYQTGLLSLGMRLTERQHRGRNGRFQILAYHRVGQATDPYTSAVSADTFARHMRVLREHFAVLSMSDLLTAAERHEVPARAVAVTFDDGYEDTFTYALPMLQQYDIPATVYLATGLLGDSPGMWNDRIGIAIRDTSRAQIDGVQGEAEPLPLRTAAERQHALRRTLESLKRQPPAQRECLTQQFIQTLGVRADRGPQMLRWEQIQHMQRRGVEFGAHTVHHPILTSIAANDREREIRDSKEAIEQHLQTPACHFAYPNGTERDFDETTKAAVRRAGFSSAVTTIFGTNTPSTDRYALHRGGPWEQDAAVFATKLWWYRWKGASGGGHRSHIGAVAP
jgi:peptidoglycan/xylan/chitin deacetylase (PgdA/CDA1 family)